MAKTTNGSIKMIVMIASIAAFAISIGVLVWDASGKSKDIEHTEKRVNYLEPIVEQNSKHRLEDEIDTPYIKEDIRDIKTQMEVFNTLQQEILIEVRK